MNTNVEEEKSRAIDGVLSSLRHIQRILVNIDDLPADDIRRKALACKV